MSHESLISEYKSKKYSNNDGITNAKNSLVKVSLELSDKKNELKNYSFWKRLFSFSLKSEIEQLEFDQDDLSGKIMSLQNNNKDLYSKLFDKLLLDLTMQKHSVAYISIDEKIKEIKNLHNEMSKLKSSGDKCIREIEEAIAAVDSAETTEMLDMVSSNSGLKLLSTMNNSTAHSEVDEANAALRNFVKEIEDFKNKEVCNIEHLNKDNLFTKLDFDITLDFLFDFYSIFTLFALSDAKSELSEILNKVKLVVKQIQESVNKVMNNITILENKKTSLLSQQKEEVKSILLNAGVSN
ncbi:TPA: hypothetical protein NV714_000207 [Escherichia coli]|nr:hypothetical protein [Escherichia coli]